jgi:hypothetical protein
MGALRGEAIDLDRQYSVREILWSTLRLYRDYPFLFTALALMVVAPYDLCTFAVTGFGPLAHQGPTKLEGTILEVLSFSLVAPLISAMHVRAILIIGQRKLHPVITEVAKDSLKVFPTVVLAEMITNAGIAVGMIAFVIPGVVLWLRWSVVAQTAAVENEGWMAALRQSGRLTFGYYWHIFGLLCTVGIFLIMLNRGVGLVPLGSESGIFSITIGIATHAVGASIVALAVAILYFDLRVRQTNTRRTSSDEYQYLRDL